MRTLSLYLNQNQAVTQTLTLNRYELRAAREWLADCAGTADVAAYWLNERSDGQGDGASDRQVRLTVGRHFKGGLVEFKRMVNAEGLSL